jgi:glycosyltransferase involved in cell wall biosynthesis
VPIVAFDLTPWSTRSRYRGIGTYTIDLARALAAAPKSELELRFLVGFAGKYRLVGSDFDLSADSVIAACGGDQVHGYQPYYLYKQTLMKRFLERSGVDLVHAPDPKGSRPGRNHKTIVTGHDLIPTVLGPPYRSYPRFVGVAIDRSRYGRHTHVIAISEWTARDLETVAGVPRRNITVVHHGVNHERFPLEGPRPDGRPYFFYVGGFDQRKQVVPLIEAFASIARDVDCRLVLAGKPDPAQRKELDTAIVRHGVEDSVDILGFVDSEDLPGWYRGAIAHVLPTLYEGFGLTALEAMSCGCPVLTLRASCVPEICGDGALYSEPGDWITWSANMRRVATDPVFRSELVARGQARAAEFTWVRAATNTLNVYRHVLGLPAVGVAAAGVAAAGVAA